MRRTHCLTALTALFAGLAGGPALRAQGQPWPLCSPNSAMPEDWALMSTQEFMEYGNERYIHGGIDVPCAPYLRSDNTYDDSAPWAVATREGTVSSLECPLELNAGCSGTTSSVGCWLRLKTGEDEERVWGHLQCKWPDGKLADLFSEGSTITLKKRIAPIAHWPNALLPTHLHYEVNTLVDNENGVKVRGYATCPAAQLDPFGAEDPPNVIDVLLAKDDASCSGCDQQSYPPCCTEWDLFPPVSDRCRDASGKVDLLVRYESFHRAGGAPFPRDPLAARRIRYKVCGESDPTCDAWGPSFDWASMPHFWTKAATAASVYYSSNPSFWIDPDNSRKTVDTRSMADYENNDVFWAVPTNVVGPAGGDGTIDKQGCWETPSTPGHYTLTVEVQDYAKLQGERRIPVCVGSGVPKLLIRDCDGDDATEPSPCDVWSYSPDVSVEGGTLLVCMRNAGNATITDVEPSKVTISIDATGRQPLPAAAWLPVSFSYSDDPEVRSLRPRSSPTPFTTPWNVGEERCAESAWPPASAPAGTTGPYELAVSVSRHGDTPNTHLSIQYDNNRATKSILDTVSPPSVGSVVRADARWPAPLGPPGPLDHVGVVMRQFLPEDYQEPTIPPPLLPQPWTFQVHVGPGATFEQVLGGVVIGVMTEEDHKAWDASKPLSQGDPGLSSVVPAEAAGARSDLWRIVKVPDGVDAVALRRPRQQTAGVLSVLAWPPPSGPRGSIEVLVRVYASEEAGRPPVEIFQEVLIPRTPERALGDQLRDPRVP